MTKLEKLKLLLGSNAAKFNDNLLELYIDQAENEFLNITNRKEIPTAAEYVILEMAVVKVNHFGTEGLSSQSFNGISDNFTDGYPTNIVNSINRFRKLKVL